MISEIPLNESHIYAFRVTGKLVENDYKLFRPKLDRLVKKYSPLSLLIELRDFEGWSAKAAWEDLKVGFQHDQDFLRIAIVGESVWEKILTDFSDLFTDTEIEYFDDNSVALAWLKEVDNRAEQDEYIGYRHILVATDFSKYADAAIKKAVELAQPFDSKISIVHAADTLSSDMYPYIGELAVPVLVDNPELAQKQQHRIEKEITEQLEKLGYSNENFETKVIADHPVNSIIEYAEKNNVDLIVMGSHGRRGLARLLGSSTNGVINHAPCDVLTVV